MGWIESFMDVEEARPELTVADVLRLHWDEYLVAYGATAEQRQVALAMMACRTAALGGHVKICSECGYIEFRRAEPSSGRSGWRIARRWYCRSSIFIPFLRWITRSTS
jgi:hypothetical protein